MNLKATRRILPFLACLVCLAFCLAPIGLASSSESKAAADASSENSLASSSESKAAADASSENSLASSSESKAAADASSENSLASSSESKAAADASSENSLASSSESKAAADASSENSLASSSESKAAVAATGNGFERGGTMALVEVNDNVLIEVDHTGEEMTITVGQNQMYTNLRIKTHFVALYGRGDYQVVIKGNGQDSSPIDLRLGNYVDHLELKYWGSPIVLKDHARVNLSGRDDPLVDVYGGVSLICEGDGAGIEVQEESELNYTGGTLSLVKGGEGGAGIGGGFEERNGKITISGGVIKEVLGGSREYDGGGAGIGSGAKGSGRISNLDSVTISGGVIEKAQGGNGAAGIGGGYKSEPGAITITGGSLTALAGEAYNGTRAAAVGPGADATKSSNVKYSIVSPGTPDAGYSYWCGNSADAIVQTQSHLQVTRDINDSPFSTHPYLRVVFGAIPPPTQFLQTQVPPQPRSLLQSQSLLQPQSLLQSQAPAHPEGSLHPKNPLRLQGLAHPQVHL